MKNQDQPPKTGLSGQTQTIHRAADAAWRRHEFDEAIELFEQAAQADPANPILQVNLARAYGLNFQYEKSASTKQQISKRFSDLSHVHYMLAESEFRYKNLESAEFHFRSAIELGLDQAHTVRSYVFLARINERLHRLDEALVAAEKAISVWPDHPKAKLIQAKILSRQGKQGRAFQIFEQLAHRNEVSPDVKAESWYAIADQRDADGEFDQAFSAYTNAKSSYQGFTNKSTQAAKYMRERNQGMLASINETLLNRWAGDAQELGPLSIPGIAWLIGHPRSGTTLFGQILDGHPKLVEADELDVFSASTFPRLVRATGLNDQKSITDILSQADTSQLENSREVFLTQIQGAMLEPIGDRLLLNKNPDLTLLLPVICRIFPESKFLFALRDPRDVVISSFTQALPVNPISIDYFSIESTVEKYAMSINVWLKMREMIPTEWLEVRYEDTVNDLESQARRALNFLGFDWNPAVLEFSQRSLNKHVHSPTYQSVTKPIYTTSIGRWRNYEKHLAPAYDQLLPFIRAFGYPD